MIKKTLFYIVLINFLIACNGEDGTHGIDGKNSLINVLEESAGDFCENAGLKIETGLDANSNGILEIYEVQNTKYICNGVDGNSSLTTVINEPSGANCVNGGIKLNSGLDINGNGNLEENEITSTAYVCDGINGTAGLIKITNENSGDNCINGGLKIDYGLDSDMDGILNENEVEYTSYTCNGLNGTLSLINITDEPDGNICAYSGIKIEAGLDQNENKILDKSEVLVTKYVCNGSSGVINEEIRLKIAEGVGSSANTTSTSPTIVSGIPFDIRNYPNVGTVYFEADPYVEKSSNHALLELYNITDNTVITSSLIRTSNRYTEKEFLRTENLINNLPNKNIVLGIRLRSEVDGSFSASGVPYLVLKE
ncbi:DUF7151 family protein [Cyclobacterium qasimii]|uniref:DUF7151 domain-containing protein n=2 Tax=Cyclobacterium qasimii TaxID=1350429 RepID=S7VIV8_9BACT|nr:hypothetical protein [Cyclobacterium qasimii]EPR69447.1 hypothetical protein ADICYQ_1549 [Cyclobacterium qasimii M12-11B]GEO22082.1 hypothetical protein CQA01_26160 [Cyclobacterium qasimii]